MFKNISNFLWNQLGGFSISPPSKSISDLSLIELQEYVQESCRSLAKQFNDSGKSGERLSELDEELNKLAEKIYGSTSSVAESFVRDLRTNGTLTQTQFVKFCKDFIVKYINFLRNEAPSRVVSSSNSELLRSDFGFLVLAPSLAAVNPRMRALIDRAPINPIAEVVEREKIPLSSLMKPRQPRNY